MYDGHERTIVYSSLDGSHACVLGVVPSTSPSTDDTLQIRHQAHPASRLSSRRSIRSRGIHRGAEEQLLPFHHLIQFGRISRTPSWTNQRVSSLPSGSIRLPTPPKGTSIGSHPRSNPRPLGLPSLSGPPSSPPVPRWTGGGFRHVRHIGVRRARAPSPDARGSIRQTWTWKANDDVLCDGAAHRLPQVRRNDTHEEEKREEKRGRPG